MKLRIHHFFDIVRDFGRGDPIKPHPYGHSYHKVAEQIRNNPNIEIEIVVGTDAICRGCSHLIKDHCTDKIDHRVDFKSKEKFNNWLDKRILEKLNLKVGDKLTPVEICSKANKYLDNVFWIYEGNDTPHTQTRKENVVKGLKYYKKLSR